MAAVTADARVWRIRVVVTGAALDLCETALAPFTDGCSWFLDDPDADEQDDASRWCVEGFARTAPDRTEVETALALALASLSLPAPDIEIALLPDTDWVLENMRDFPPIAAGRFFVHGSHFTGRVPPGRIGLEIDAGAAFGSGDHATTRGCLLAIDRLLRRRKIHHALDLGCGSAILAIALAKAGVRQGLASDIDPTATRVASRNAARNGVAARLRLLTGVGYRHPAIARHRSFDLIVANILSGPLRAMAPDLARHLAPGGVAVLSGLLRRHEAAVLAAHRPHGLSLYARLRLQGWSTVVLTRSPAMSGWMGRDSRADAATAPAAPPPAGRSARAD